MSDEENYGHECVDCGDWTFEEGERCPRCQPVGLDADPCGCVPMGGAR